MIIAVQLRSLKLKARLAAGRAYIFFIIVYLKIITDVNEEGPTEFNNEETNHCFVGFFFKYIQTHEIKS